MSSNIIWQGIYASLDDIVASGKGFEGGRWMERIRGQLLDYRADDHYLASPPRPSDLPVLCAITGSSKIIDFGGSSGWTFEYLKRTLEMNAIVKYIIVELEEVCEYIKKMSFHDKNKEVFCAADVVCEKMDILYSNSALQYMADDVFLMKIINHSMPEYILLEDFFGGEFDDYYSLQKYYDHTIPVKFRNRKEFITKILKAGYSLKYAKPYMPAIRGEIQELYMDNFPKNLRVRYGETLLFERNSND